MRWWIQGPDTTARPGYEPLLRGRNPAMNMLSGAPLDTLLSSSGGSSPAPSPDQAGWGLNSMCSTQFCVAHAYHSLK